MPFLFIIVGLVMVTAAARNTVADDVTTKQLGLTHLLRNDFTGKNNFVYWVLSILIVGAIGYIKPLQPVSRAFMLLIIIVLFLTNKGVFAQFNEALAGTQQQAQ
jgi:hypothetical protein